MRILQLRYFVTVAQLENISRAAELLHLSQSSLSKNIATLEEELGMPLFERSGRRLTLNPAGVRLLEFSNMMLKELDYAMEDMRQLSGGADQRIRIGAAGMPERLFACMSGFRALVPEAEFEISGDIESREHLDINEFDMLIYPDSRRYEKLTGSCLYEEKYYLAVPAGHRLAEEPAVRAAALENENVIFLRSGRQWEEYPWQICSALALRFSAVSFADTRELHCRMIAEGLGVGFVPLESADAYRDQAVCLIPIRDQRFSRRMMICFRKDKYLTPLARRFRDYISECFALESGGQNATDGSASTPSD